MSSSLNLNDWLDTKIKDEDIHYFEYDEFSDVKRVAAGGFGIINRAYWENGDTVIALKVLKNEINQANLSEFLKELNSLRRVGFHKNINQFFGITKDPLTNNYVMVLQYANQGNLREYLKDKNNFNSLKWNDKIRMASDIAIGLKFLHSRKIIHRDLHSKNILVHEKKLMIADLGLSKRLNAEVTSFSKIYGMSAYVEPQCFRNENYIRNEKSDVYSLGVLLWELTSGRPPFQTTPDEALIFKIANGKREQPIDNTPSEYVNLYQKCWDNDPDLRPFINDACDILKKLLNTESDHIITTIIPENLENLNINKESDKSIVMVTDKKDEIISTSMSFSFDSLLQTNQINISDIEKILADEIIQSYLKEHYNGWKSYYDLILEKYKPISREIFSYLTENQTVQYYTVLLGDFHYKGFGTTKNDENAFKQYEKASQQNNPIGYFKVGYCHSFGYGTKKNVDEAFKCYKLAADKGLNIALYYLAEYYKSGNVVPKDDSKVFELYKKSAENGFIPSQYHLASCYNLGEGTQEDKRMALEWFKFYQGNDGEHDVSSEIKDIEEELGQNFDKVFPQNLSDFGRDAIF